MQKLTSCLWFDTQAEDAAKFYLSVFKNSKITRTACYGESAAQVSGQKKGSVMTVEFEIEHHKILGLNGGPAFKMTPALSFFIWCESDGEIDTLWKKLSDGGNVRMGLDKYPWSEKYGWTADKYGVEWQVMLSKEKQKIAPAFLFVDALFGKGEEAVSFYRSQFENSKIEFLNRDDATGTIKHCVFTLAGQPFVAMEGPGKHGFSFSLAFSLMVQCQTQAEIDRYWADLAEGGETSQCGWLKDKYGVSWQIVPAQMSEWMSSPVKAERVMHALIQMTKLDLAKLKAAAQG